MSLKLNSGLNFTSAVAPSQTFTIKSKKVQFLESAILKLRLIIYTHEGKVIGVEGRRQ